MNLSDIEKKALKIIGGNKKPKSRSTKRKVDSSGGRYKPGKSFGRQLQILADLKAGEKVFVSTIDVELTKWRFQEATGEKINLIPTFNDGTIYKIELI